ncbi:RNA polymerase factor sigma-54 [Jiulongibacter sp. NS-SX5]|uniref:RNA polymerase factor sigma-54 n=1 Tax=Jiulongibacter sp. NS-SX5 TaxID=3463854 RepID=UPI004059EB45
MTRNIQVQTAKQSQRINTKQIQFLNFLFLNQNELEGHVEKELLENPFLEQDVKTENTDSGDSSDDILGEMRVEEVYTREMLEDDMPSYKLKSNNYFDQSTADLSLQRHTEEVDVSEVFMEQIRFLGLNDEELELAHFIINSTDEKGFLDTDLESFVDHVGFATGKFYDESLIEKVKKQINELEPAGFACYDLQDYFLTLVSQASEADKSVLENAKLILSEHFESFKSAKWNSILEEMDGIERADIDQVLQLISTFKPYPTKGFGTDWLQIKNEIVPDYEIKLIDGELVGEVANSKKYNFSVNAAYANSMKGAKGATGSFVNEKLKSAYWLIDAIQQRYETMNKVIKAIVHLQGEYLMSGDNSKLRPMILKDVATYIDMNISTVSRVTSNKYARSPIGLIHLKDLFSEAIYLEDGSRKSNKEVQDMVVRLVEEEDKTKPLSDFDIQKALKREGISLTRRTITKYRLSGNIPSSKERKVS